MREEKLEQILEDLPEDWIVEESEEEKTILHFTKEGTRRFKSSVALLEKTSDFYKWASWDKSGNWVGEAKNKDFDNTINDILEHIEEGQPRIDSL